MVARKNKKPKNFPMLKNSKKISPYQKWLAERKIKKTKPQEEPEN